MRSRCVLALFLMGLIVAGCEDAEERDRSAATRSSPRVGDHQEKERNEGGVRERERTRPAGVPVENLALNRADRRAVDRAVEDLKRLGFWRRLTRQVESVIVSTRPGAGNVPEDGHLADAIRNVTLGRPPGYTCDVMIFSHALERDVALQRVYYAQGRLPHPAPTLRQFWAVILAHELAHCTDRGASGEGYSTTWERRVLEAYGAARLGS